MAVLNATHDPAVKSWVASANGGGDFPIQNLPHGVFATSPGSDRGGVAIGDQILDLKAALDAGLFDGEAADIARAAAEPTLNRLMAMGNGAAGTLRARLWQMLREGSPDEAAAEACLVPMASAEMKLPARIGAFTDFCTSTFHITPRAPRPPRKMHEAFKHLPVAYNSRATSLTVDGQPMVRPNGQAKDRAADEIYFGPSRQMDFELELGLYIGGPGNDLGQPVNIDDTAEMIWGYCLVNDWSARDIQFFESMLGPFLSKSVRTTISPWIVTAEAMAPFHTMPFQREADDPRPLPYLTSPAHEKDGCLDLGMYAWLRTAAMRAAGMAPQKITDTNFAYSFWTFPQMVTHHASNGCNLQTADLIASGTVSGPRDEQAACLLELTYGGAAIPLPTGESRVWLEDGDEIILTARAQAPGRTSIGFGTCGAEVTPAPAWPQPKSAQAVAEPSQ